jgi:hypothetical protein
MVHRRTAVAIIALLTLVFMFTAYSDSHAASLLGDRTSRAKDESVVAIRAGGSMLSTTGDPDELATGFGGDGGEGLGAVGWIRPSDGSSEPGSGGVDSVIIMLILDYFRLGEIEFAN